MSTRGLRGSASGNGIGGGWEPAAKYPAGLVGKTRSLLTQVASGIPMGSSWTVEAYAQYWLENVAAETLRPSTFSS